MLLIRIIDGGIVIGTKRYKNKKDLGNNLQGSAGVDKKIKLHEKIF